VVKPLPEAGKPANFKSAVGKFEMIASLQKNTISTDDAGSLKIIISGQGNIQMINAPEIKWPPGIEGFETKSTENIDKLSVPMKGQKIFVYPFTIQNEGEHVIPVVEFSYFDAGSQAYKSIKTNPLTVTVKKGKGNANILNTPAKNKAVKNNNTLYYNRWYILSGILFLCALLFLILKRNKITDNKISLVNEIKTEDIDAFVIPVNPLSTAENLLLAEKPHQFYKELDNCLKSYLSKKLKISGQELSRKKINERLDKCNVTINTSLLVNSVLEDIELNLYAMASSKIQMEAVYNKANEVVSLLDKQVC